jgi:hypothetical protein
MYISVICKYFGNFVQNNYIHAYNIT